MGQHLVTDDLSNALDDNFRRQLVNNFKVIDDFISNTERRQMGVEDMFRVLDKTMNNNFNQLKSQVVTQDKLDAMNDELHREIRAIIK